MYIRLATTKPVYYYEECVLVSEPTNNVRAT